MAVKITERGWAGHFICADRCRYRRNTLVEGEAGRVVVSSVGNMVVTRLTPEGEKGKAETVGAFGRWYGTMVFDAVWDGTYWDADVGRQRSDDGDLEWQISADTYDDLPKDADSRMDRIHDETVAFYAKKLGRGAMSIYG